MSPWFLWRRRWSGGPGTQAVSPMPAPTPTPAAGNRHCPYRADLYFGTVCRNRRLRGDFRCLPFLPSGKWSARPAPVPPTFSTSSGPQPHGFLRRARLRHDTLSGRRHVRRNSALSARQRAASGRRYGTRRRNRARHERFVKPQELHNPSYRRQSVPKASDVRAGSG